MISRLRRYEPGQKATTERDRKVMKIALIGAAGVRTPLLVHGLAGAGENVRIDELALWDTDQARLQTIARVAEAMAER